MASFPANYKIVTITLATTLLLLVIISSISAFQIDKVTLPQNALDIVSSHVQKAINKEARMGASLLRLHFHDCFVNGCDGSILLDISTGEQGAIPNRNSIRGLDIIDSIKGDLEKANHHVSCADILAIVARDAVVKLGGPTWKVTLGRLDSKSASQTAANKGIPSPKANIKDLVKQFVSLNLTITDLVALSGAHTVGLARCIGFRDRIHNTNGSEVLNKDFATQRKVNCLSAPSAANDKKTAPLDIKSATRFDNQYFKDLRNATGLLHSDQQLFSGGNRATRKLVDEFAARQGVFFNDFAKAMIRMGNIGILTGSKGEIRRNCGKHN